MSAGLYGREWRTASTRLTRALGRPIRDQVHSVRPVEATTLQALELVNGEILTKWLSRGAKRLVGELPLEPRSLFNASVAGRYAAARRFDVDVASASKLWLVVTDTGSNAPERIEPMWVQAAFVQADGTAVPLSILTPSDASGLRGAIRGRWAARRREELIANRLRHRRQGLYEIPRQRRREPTRDRRSDPR